MCSCVVTLTVAFIRMTHLPIHSFTIRQNIYIFKLDKILKSLSIIMLKKNNNTTPQNNKDVQQMYTLMETWLINSVNV